MSELAQTYYQERADRLDIDYMPPILNGQPVPLTDEELAPISVHQPDSDSAIEAGKRLNAELHSTHSFLLKGVPDHPTYPKAEVPSLAAKNEAFARGFIGKLLIPRAVKTGRVGSISLEAIARPEIAPAALNRIKESAYRDADHIDNEDYELYFRVDGTLKSGSRTIPVGGLIVARAVRALQYAGVNGNAYATAIHYGGTPLKSNETSGTAIQDESKMTHQAITEHSLRRAYTSPVGTSKRQHGQSR